MEDPSRRDDLARFVRGQSAATVSQLGQLPQHAELVKLIDSAARAGARVSRIRVAGHYTFWRELDPNDRVPKLMVRSPSGTRVLYDPGQETGNAAGPAAINSYNVSPDAKTVAVHVSFGGAEIGAIRFIDTETGVEKLSRLSPVWGEFTAQWLSRDKVTFTRMPDKVVANDRLQGMTAVLGTPGQEFKPVLGPGIKSGPDFPQTAFPLIFTSELSDLVVGLADNAINPAVYLAHRKDLLAGNSAWTPVATPADGIGSFSLFGTELYMISTRDKSDGEIVRVSARTGDRQIIPAPTGFVLSGLVAARDGIYVVGQREGISHLFWMVDRRSPAREIPLPFEATINDLMATADGAGATFLLSGWTTAPRGYIVEGGKLSALSVESGSWPEVSKLRVRRELAKSADGTEVPLVIIDRGPELTDGVALIEAYGSYGESTAAPSYDPYMLAWSVRGHAMVYCGTRGGGERGRAWHDGGRERNKANAHADLIACANRLIELHIADPKRIAITGTSAGGLLAPVVAEKRPDLFGALVARVAILNATRLEVAENGANNFGEMGNPATKAGWRALAAQDAYLQLSKASDLPDTLLTIGLNDHRVAPWMSAKFAARAEEKFGDKRLILIRAESEGGHGVGSARDLQVQEFADIFTFLEDRLDSSQRRLKASAR
jgi:prolyl oligopeptidase